MTKFRLYFDKDKETVWLNEMAAKGYALFGFFAGFYTFEKTEPGEYIYQIDLGEKLFAVTDDYRGFMEETGVEIVDTWGYWIFLRKKAADGEFELYTDVDSQIEHYTKIRNMFKVVSIIELICFIVEVICFDQSNEPALIFCVILIGILAFVCIKATFKTNRTIAELKERKGETVNLSKRNGPSPILTSGLFLSSCALLMDNPALETYKTIIQIVAIALMLIGLAHTGNQWKKDKEL